MKNNLNELNNHLFAQLDRLEAAKEGRLREEIERSKAIGLLAKMIIDNAALSLEAQQTLYAQTALGNACKLPEMIGTVK